MMLGHAHDRPAVHEMQTTAQRIMKFKNPVAQPISTKAVVLINGQSLVNPRLLQVCTLTGMGMTG